MSLELDQSFLCVLRKFWCRIRDLGERLQGKSIQLFKWVASFLGKPVPSAALPNIWLVRFYSFSRATSTFCSLFPELSVCQVESPPPPGSDVIGALTHPASLSPPSLHPHFPLRAASYSLKHSLLLLLSGLLKRLFVPRTDSIPSSRSPSLCAGATSPIWPAMIAPNLVWVHLHNEDYSWHAASGPVLPDPAEKRSAVAALIVPAKCHPQSGLTRKATVWSDRPGPASLPSSVQREWGTMTNGLSHYEIIHVWNDAVVGLIYIN